MSKRKTLNVALATMLIPGFLVMSNSAAVQASNDLEITKTTQVYVEQGEVPEEVAPVEDVEQGEVPEETVPVEDVEQSEVPEEIAPVEDVEQSEVPEEIAPVEDVEQSEVPEDVAPVEDVKQGEVPGDLPIVVQPLPEQVVEPIEKPIPEIIPVEIKETEGLKMFKESEIGQMVNLGNNINAKKVSDNEAIAELTESISFDSLESKLQNIKDSIQSLLDKEIGVTPLNYNDVVEGEAYVTTGLNIPFAYINRDTNTVKLLSQVERLSVKITIN